MGLEVLLCWWYFVVGEIFLDVFINFAELQKMIVLLIQYLFELIVCDVVELEKVLLVGVKFGINIVLDYLYSESFKVDIQKLFIFLFVYYFQIVLEIIECDMLKE